MVNIVIDMNQYKQEYIASKICSYTGLATGTTSQVTLDIWGINTNIYHVMR